MSQESRPLTSRSTLHQRTESDASHSYSVLDYYDNETIGMSDIASNPASDQCNAGFEDGYLPLISSIGKTTSSPQSAMNSADSVNSTSISGQAHSFIHVDTSQGDISMDTETLERLSLTLHGDPTLNTRIPPMIAPLTEQSLNRSLRDKFDIYGFKKDSSLFNSTQASYNAWFKEYIPHYLTQKKKWVLSMKAHGLTIQNTKAPTRFPPKSEKIKKLVRRGIPPEWRGNAWFFYAGGFEKLNKNLGVYEKIVADTKGMHNKDTEVIERDLHRTFPDNKYFKPELLVGSDTDLNRPEASMISALRRLLIAFAQYKPQIGYCQSLNFLAGLLLLFMSEEMAFWMLVIITERIIPQVHSANLEGVHTDQGVLMICIHEYIPKLWSIIGKSFDGTVLKDDKILTRPPPLTLVTSAWFMSMFVGILPIESVLRFWDIIFYEGSKSLFRLSLTICRLCMDHPNFTGNKTSRHVEEQETDRIEIFQFIQNFPKSITDPSLLINLCFKKIGGYGYGFLSQDEINRCREFVAQQRSRLRNKKGALAGVDLSDQERAAVQNSVRDDDIHDVYGFQKSIMSGVAWNMHISSVMKKKLAKRPE